MISQLPSIQSKMRVDRSTLSTNHVSRLEKLTNLAGRFVQILLAVYLIPALVVVVILGLIGFVMLAGVRLLNRVIRHLV